MMKKSLFLVLFCLFFCLSLFLSGKSGATGQTNKNLKQKDIERALKYEKLKNAKGTPLVRDSLLQALPVDTDDDGMPDWWETANGLNPNDPADAWFDPDNDKVVNLFEYQLGSALNSKVTPPVATVAASGADYTDVATAIDSVAAGTAIRVAGGTYSVNYMVFAEKRVMIQGGWNSDFSKRDLKLYPTTFDGGMNDEILYFSIASGSPVVILDGLNFKNGNGHFGAVNLLANSSAFLTTSILDCTITASASTASWGSVLCMHNWDTSQSDRTIANTLIAGNTASGTCNQITGDTSARWRIINTTISHNTNGGGNNGYGIDAFTLDNGALTANVHNSIIWGNDTYAISISRNIIVNADHSDIDDVDSGDADYNAGAGMKNLDPLFVDVSCSNFHLQALSPAINAALPGGIPLTDIEGKPRIYGSAPDMGAYEFQGKDDFLGTWTGQGVYYRNSDTGSWVNMATPATKIAAGDIDNDGIDDLLGIWPSQGGVWVKYSSDSTWEQLSSTADWIGAGDMNGDGRDDLLGTWIGQGVYYRDSDIGSWILMATPATQITAGDIDNDGTDDLLGIWPSQGGVWVKYSSDSSWEQLSSTADWIGSGDMTGDGRDDLLGTWSGQGVYYRDSASGNWILMATPATKTASGDLDGDGTDDLLGIWPSQGGVWVKYSSDSTWERLSSTADWIACGKMRGASSGSSGTIGLSGPFGGVAEGPDILKTNEDLLNMGPGGSNFLYKAEENLIPMEQREVGIIRIPGPGEPGFKYAEQKNLVPGQGLKVGKNRKKNE